MTDPRKVSWMPLALLVVAAILYFAVDWRVDLPPYGLDFHAEEVRAKPRGDAVRFSGTYIFRPSHGRRRSYAVAFPVHTREGEPAIQQAMVQSGKRRIPFRVSAQGLFFEIPVEPGQDTVVEIAYTLPAPERQATYITRTANTWPHRLARARFVVPAGVRSNYHEAGKRIAEFRDFHPKEDWTIFWK